MIPLKQGLKHCIYPKCLEYHPRITGSGSIKRFNASRSCQTFANLLIDNKYSYDILPQIGLKMFNISGESSSCSGR